MVKFVKKYWIFIWGIIETVILYLAFCFSTIAYKQQMFICASLLFFGLGVIVYIYLFRKLAVTKKYENYFSQVCWINCFMMILLGMLIIRGVHHSDFTGYKLIILWLYFGAVCICFFEILKKYGYTNLKKFIKSCVEKFKAHYLLLVVILGFILLSVYHGGTPYKWDSGLYYMACSKTDMFSISSLALYGHISQTVGLIVSAGKIILGNLETAILASNIIVAIGGIVAFYGIIIATCKNINKIDAVLATMVYAYSAYNLGMVNYFSLDYYCACLFPLAVYFMIKRKWVYHFAVAFLFCFTKEPAIIIYFGLAVAYLLFCISSIYKKEKKLDCRKIFTIVPCWYMILVGGLWLVTYMLLGPWSAGAGGLTCNINFILNKLMVLFIFNFSWWFLLLGIIGIFCNLYRKKIGKCWMYFMIPAVFFTLFACFFATANHYRYNAIVLFVLCYFSMAFVVSWESNVLKKFVLIISCMISLCSVYFSVDPVSNMLFSRVPTGNGYMWSTDSNSRMADYSIYNKQMLWRENIMNQLLKQPIEQEDYIILQADDGNVWYADGLAEFKNIKNDKAKYTFYWDEELKQRVNSENVHTKECEIMQINDIKGLQRILETDKTSDCFCYISMKGEDEEVVRFIQENCCILEIQQKNLMNWAYQGIRFKANR